MSRDIDRLLQECLAGLDTGLTPEECLSAWPEHRAELEPLLRQAMLLRMSYTATPSPEFRTRAREKLMFMAGREATQAMSAEPDEAFKIRTRNKLLHAAGSREQEALRAVPPPRLAFWANARRRLLEAAASSAPAPSPRPMALAVRSGLSAAVVVLAIAVAGLAYFSTAANSPSVGAELAQLDEQVREVEAMRQSGGTVPATIIQDLTSKTLAAVEKIDGAEAPQPLALQAQELINRQQRLIESVRNEGEAPQPVLQAAQQQLSQAEDRVRVAAAGSSAFTPSAVLTQPTIAPNTGLPPTQVPEVTSTPAASASAATQTPAETPVALGPNDILLRPKASDTTFGIAWSEVLTSRFSMVIPSSWKVVGPAFNEDGIGRLSDAYVTIYSGDAALVLAIDLNTGLAQGILNSQSIGVLRDSSGKVIGVAELLAKAPGFEEELFHALNSIVVEPPPSPTATPSPSPTPRPTETADDD